MDFSGFSIVGHLFSTALQQKRFIFSVLLIAIVLNFFVPAFAYAQGSPPSPDDPSNNPSRFCRDYPWSIFCFTKEGGFQNALKESNSGLIGSVIRSIGELYVFFAKTFAKLSYEIFDWVSGIFVKNTTGQWAITNNQGDNRGAILAPVFLVAWNIAKQWANVIIVIALIAVALAFMLNISALENYRKLLLPILVAALFINFSGLLVGLLIDIANVALLTFLGPGTTASFGSGTIFATMEKLWSSISTSGELRENAIIFTAHAVIFGIIFAMMGFTTLIMSVLFMIRYIMLAILFIVSPLAIALSLLPIKLAQETWSKWFGLFIHWAIAGVVAAFFTNLGIQMAQAMFGGQNLPPLNTANPLATITPFIVKSLIVIMFLLAGMYMAIKSSTAVTMIMGAAAGLVTGGLSLAGKASGGALKAIAPGAYDRFQRARDTLSDNKLLNPIRDLFAGPGASATMRQNRMQARMKEYLPQMENMKNADLAKWAPIRGAKGAAAAEILHKRESIDEIKNQADKKIALDNLMAHDNKKKPSDFSKIDYRAAELLVSDEDMQKKIADLEATGQGRQKIAEQRATLKKNTLLPPNELDRQAREIVVKQMVRQQALEGNISKMSDNQIRNIKKDDWTPEFITSINMNPSAIKKLKTADIDIIAKVTNSDVENELDAQIVKAAKEGNRREVNRLQNIGNELLRLKLSSGLPLTVKRFDINELPEAQDARPFMERYAQP